MKNICSMYQSKYMKCFNFIYDLYAKYVNYTRLIYILPYMWPLTYMAEYMPFFICHIYDCSVWAVTTLWTSQLAADVIKFVCLVTYFLVLVQERQGTSNDNCGDGVDVYTAGSDQQGQGKHTPVLFFYYRWVTGIIGLNNLRNHAIAGRIFHIRRKGKIKLYCHRPTYAICCICI